MAVGRTSEERASGRSEGDAFQALGPEMSAVLALGTELTRLLDHVTRRRGSLSFSQFQLLALLRAGYPEPKEPWELGRGLGSASAQISTLLDGLERAGLAERRAHGQDRRRRWVHLTDRGRERVEEVAELIGALETRILDGALAGAERRRMGVSAERLRAVVGEMTASDLSFLLLAEPGHAPDEAV